MYVYGTTKFSPQQMHMYTHLVYQGIESIQKSIPTQTNNEQMDDSHDLYHDHGPIQTNDEKQVYSIWYHCSSHNKINQPDRNRSVLLLQYSVLFL